MSQDRSLRPTVLVVSGTIAAALIGWWSNHLANRFENARLITDLQIQREQAETTLRGVVFDQTMKAFLSDRETLEDRSKQLLQLELLSLNFGDTVSLTPLFVEFQRDLNRTKVSNAIERETVQLYQRRLRSLARQVASNQFSSLALRGVAKDSIEFTLDSRGVGFVNGLSQFVWPRHQVEGEFGHSFDALGAESRGNADLVTRELAQGMKERFASLECMTLDGSTRKVEIAVASPDFRDMEVSVQLKIWDAPLCGYAPDDNGGPIVDLQFSLDFFNFPKIDNTRLTNNQRFALIMESYDAEVGKIRMAAVIFPSEYASLSDRPGMREAVQIMEDAQSAD